MNGARNRIIFATSICTRVVDGVIGERGKLLRSVGGRGSGAHRAEGVDGCRGATAREFGSAAKTEKGEFSFDKACNGPRNIARPEQRAREKEIGI